MTNQASSPGPNDIAAEITLRVQSKPGHGPALWTAIQAALDEHGQERPDQRRWDLIYRPFSLELDDWGFSRTINGLLTDGGFGSVHILSTTTEEELLELDDFGYDRLRSVIRKLGRRGRFLANAAAYRLDRLIEHPELNLSAQAYESLKKAGCHRLVDLLALDQIELRKLGLSGERVRGIAAAVANAGLELANLARQRTLQDLELPEVILEQLAATDIRLDTPLSHLSAVIEQLRAAAASDPAADISIDVAQAARNIGYWR